MTPSTVPAQASESALAAFVAAMPTEEGVQLRSLAHAWALGGGAVAVGKAAVRLVGRDGFTAGTLYAARGTHPARLELSRVLLEKHGVSAEAWIAWADECADLAHHGFVAAAKYPAIPLGGHLSPAELARLVGGLRDLAAVVA